MTTMGAGSAAQTYDELGLPYYSQSKLGMWERCGEQYRRRWIEGEVIPPGVAALRGTAVHEGARANFRQKLESREDLPAGEIVEVAVEKIRTEAAGGVMLTEDEVARGLKAVIAEAIDETARYARAHAELQAPDYQPLIVEERISIPSGLEGVELQGTIDLLDDQQRLVDLKTKAKTPAERDVHVSPQLTLYSALAKARTKQEPKSVRQDVLVGLKRGVERRVLETTRGPADYAALAQRLTAMDASIKAGHFPPASPEHWACSPSYCGYYRTCRFVNPNR